MSEPLAVSIPEVTKLTGLGRSLLYKEIAAGQLRVVKVGRRSIILLSDLRTWLEHRSGSTK